MYDLDTHKLHIYRDITFFEYLFPFADDASITSYLVFPMIVISKVVDSPQSLDIASDVITSYEIVVVDF